MMFGYKRFILIAILLCLPIQARAEPPMLVITGNISIYTDKDKKEYRFTEEQFMKLKQHQIITKTTWTPVATFTGPSMTDVLNTAGAHGKEINVITYDDYKTSIPIEDFAHYNVILAHSMNGKRLERRNYGPLWIIYPASDFSELQSSKLNSRFAWQVKEIVAR